MAALCFEAAVPPTIKDIIQSQAKAANIPRVGSHANVMFTTVQANISAAEPFSPGPLSLETSPSPLRRSPRHVPEDNAEGYLDVGTAAEKDKCEYCLFIGCSMLMVGIARHRQQIGNFATIHRDNKDSRGAYTTMLWNNDIPESGYHCGDLFLAEVGVAVSLKGLGCVIFNGLHYHGGRPPTPMTAEAEVKDWPYRLVTVHYPHAIPLDGNAVTAWMPFPSSSMDAKGVFCVRPELMHWRWID